MLGILLESYVSPFRLGYWLEEQPLTGDEFEAVRAAKRRASHTFAAVYVGTGLPVIAYTMAAFRRTLRSNRELRTRSWTMRKYFIGAPIAIIACALLGVAAASRSFSRNEAVSRLTDKYKFTENEYANVHAQQAPWTAR